jgi:hypothetical protein
LPVVIEKQLFTTLYFLTGKNDIRLIHFDINFFTTSMVDPVPKPIILL